MELEKKMTCNITTKRFDQQEGNMKDKSAGKTVLLLVVLLFANPVVALAQTLNQPMYNYVEQQVQNLQTANNNAGQQIQNLWTANNIVGQQIQNLWTAVGQVSQNQQTNAQNLQTEISNLKIVNLSMLYTIIAAPGSSGIGCNASDVAISCNVVCPVTTPPSTVAFKVMAPTGFSAFDVQTNNIAFAPFSAGQPGACYAGCFQSGTDVYEPPANLSVVCIPRP